MTCTFRLLRPAQLLGSLFLLLQLGSCAVFEQDYETAYRKEWKAIIQSEAWEASLQGRDNDLLASSETNSSGTWTAEATNWQGLTTTDALFTEKYGSLVSRAYYRIIAEAAEADAKITVEYERLQQENKVEGPKDKRFKKTLEMASKRYHAHRNMLQGLRSWNIFSEDRTADLDFFKAENAAAILRKIQAGESDETITAYLIYRLADLYHFTD